MHRRQVNGDPCTPKQREFVSCWDGSIKSTAAKAGVSHGTAKRWMSMEMYRHIQQAIVDLDARRCEKGMVSVERLVNHLAKIALNERADDDDPGYEPKDQIAAADKILKVHGAYLTRIEHSASDGLGEILAAARARVAAAGADRQPQPRVSQT